MDEQEGSYGVPCHPSSTIGEIPSFYLWYLVDCKLVKWNLVADVVLLCVELDDFFVRRVQFYDDLYVIYLCNFVIYYLVLMIWLKILVF